MEPWLVAVVIRPFGSLALLSFAAFVAYKLIGPLIPDGAVKRLLYDRSIRKNHPWWFALGGAVAIYGTIALVALIAHIVHR